MIQFDIDKDSFIKYFLNPIKKINIEGTCSLSSKAGMLCSLATTADKSCIIYAKHKPESKVDDFDPVHISDVKRLILALKCIPEDKIHLTIDQEKLFYTGKTFKFSSYLLDSQFVAKIGVNGDKIDSIAGDTYFTVSPAALKNIKIAQLISPDATKLYFYTENGQVFVNLNDKVKSKIDNASVILSESYNGREIDDSFIISGEFFKLITQFEDNILFKLNLTKGYLIIEAEAETYNLKYLTSALHK